MFYYSYPDIHGMPSALIPALVGLRHGLREALLFEVTQSEIKQITTQVNKLGLCSGIGGRHRWAKGLSFMYIAKQPSVVKKCIQSERNDPITLGKIFGYPECCTASFLNRWQQHKINNSSGEPNFPYLAFRDTKGHPWPELNNLLWYINGKQTPYYLISHFPCSYRCEKSLDHARNISRLLNDEYPRLARRIRSYISLPILLFHTIKSDVWDENNGYVFSGKSERDTITYRDVYPLRIPRDTRPFRQGNRLHNQKDKINIFSNKKLVNSIVKDSLFEAVIFPFDR
jgi:hypothetical protein